MKVVGILAFVVLVGVGGYFLLAGQDDISFYDTENGENGQEDIEDMFATENSEIYDLLSRAEDISSVQYEVFINSPIGVMEMMYYQKGGKVRVEMGEGDDVILSVINPDDDVYYSIITSMNMATRISDEDVEDMKERGLQHQAITMKGESLREVGQETLDGRETTVVEFEDDGETVTVWIWDEYGIPVKSHITVEGWGEVETTVGKVEFVDISDDMFVLPEGVEIIDSADTMINI